MAETVGVGMLGLGTVGTEVARRLITEWQLLTDRAGATPVLRRVAVRDLTRPRDVDLKNARIGDNAFDVVDDPAVRVVVEVMGGDHPATALIERALIAGKIVVTANKRVIASDGPRLCELAAEHATSLWFEAAVGGGLPIVALLRDSLSGDRIARIDSIINGTTNVILTQMRRDGVTLAGALAEAQRRGYAEADPSADLDGWDATQKLVIMSWLAFGVRVDPDDVDRVGIGGVRREDLGYTGQLGYAVKLVAHAHREGDGVHLRVRPTAVPQGHELFDVDDSDNAVIISSDLANELTLRGLGAGGASTASAVVSDIVNAVRRRHTPPAPLPAGAAILLDDETVEVAGYVRLCVNDEPEARELVLQALADRGVPVAESVDKPPIDGPYPQLIVLTGAAPRAVHVRALETLDSLPVVRQIVAAFDRIEPEP